MSLLDHKRKNNVFQQQVDSISLSTSQADGIVSADHDTEKHSVQQSRPNRWSLSGVQLIFRTITSRRPADANGKRPWQTTLFRFGPLSGILALIIALLSLMASLGILAGSDGVSVNDWPTSPSTYLAIFTALGNLSMRYAAFQGIVIAWWIKALHGSSIGKLHKDWRSGTSLRSTVLAGRHMGWSGLACIFATVVIVDGPLLQRSSTIATAAYQHAPVRLNISMAPEIPRDYTGTWWVNAGVGLPTSEPEFNKTIPMPHGRAPNNVVSPGGLPKLGNALNHWDTNDPIPGVVTGCPGKCTAQILAPAIAATACTTHIYDVNYTANAVKGIPTDFFGPIPLGAIAFILQNELVVTGEQEQIQIVNAYSWTEDCVGKMNFTVCTYQSAIGEYNITIDDNSFTIDDAANPRIVALANNSHVNPQTHGPMSAHPSTLGGVVGNLINELNEFVWYSEKDGRIEQWIDGDVLGNTFSWGDDNGACFDFDDTLGISDVLRSFNRVMVLYGRAAALKELDPYDVSSDPYDSGVQVHTNAIGARFGDHDVYSTNYWIFLAAALVELVCILFVAPTYWGWWRLGRAVSFSPLEIAKAFEAPLLADINSNSPGKDVGQAYSDMQIRYGVATADGKQRLAFADPKTSEMPKQGAVFDV